MGALKALLSKKERRQAEKIPDLVKYVELAADAAFQDTLVEGIGFAPEK